MLIGENKKIILNDVVCKHPEAGSCKHSNELYDCMNLGDILTT